MKKAYVLIIFCMVVVGLWMWKKSKTSMTVVFPEKSVFFIDQDLSSDFKKNIENSIQSAYSLSKNPQEVIDQATAQFPEISSMKVQICQSDKICFYVDACDPVFLLNHEFVVCGNGTKSLKDNFSLDIVQSLVQVSCSKGLRFPASNGNDIDKNNDQELQGFGFPIGVGNDNCVNAIIDFVVALPEKFKQEFLIEWVDQDNITLQPKDGKNCILHVSAQAVPSLSDLQACQKIAQEAQTKSKTKKKRMVYDVRFKNQIIVR